MNSSFDLVTFDVPEPESAAVFWRAALGLVELQREDVDRWIVVGQADGVRRIGLQRGAAKPGGVHLDLVCALGDFDDELERLLALDARLMAPPRRESYGAIANLVDPFGYLFDLCAYV